MKQIMALDGTRRRHHPSPSFPLPVEGRGKPGEMRLLDEDQRFTAMPKRSAEFRKVFRELQRYGLLLESDPRLPSLTQLVAGEPMKGSWWGHPKGRLIFRITREIAAHPDVAVTKLISGKVTFVHRKLWPTLLAVATAHEPWQTRKLSAAARGLLKLVSEKGQAQTDQGQARGARSSRSLRQASLPGARLFPAGRREQRPGRSRSPDAQRSESASQAARELENKLLVHGEQFHSDSGAHAKRLETWEHWAERVGFADKLPTVDQAKATFEKIVTSLSQHCEGNGKLPWKTGPSIGKSS